MAHIDLEKYNDPIIKILLVAACVSLLLAFIENDFIETIGIFIAIFLATTVGFWFERDAAKKFELLTAMNDEQLDQVTGGTILPYRVKAGDSLASIAKKYNVTVEQLMKWNNIQDPNMLTIGQQLKIKF